MHSANFELKKFCIYIEDLYFSSGPLAPSVTRAGILVSATQRDKLVYRLVASHSFTRRAKRKPRNSPFCKRKINQCETRPVTKFNGEPLQFHAKIPFARRTEECFRETNFILSLLLEKRNETKSPIFISVENAKKFRLRIDKDR